MKRTTICRSRGARLAAAVLLVGLVGAPAAAQQPQSPQQPAVAAPAAHVVQQGETLWALAQQFLGDPLLWPEIYRLNTAVIEDPHWIFPGEELRLQPGAEALIAAAAPDTGAAAAITVSPAPTDTAAAPPAAAALAEMATGPTIFAGRRAAGGSTLELSGGGSYRAVRAGEHYSAGFLTGNEILQPGRLVGNVQTASISRLSTSGYAMLYSTWVVEPPPGDALKRGDLLISYTVPRSVPGYGDIVRPSGLLRVTDVGAPGEVVQAQVIRVYQSIATDQPVLQVPAFQDSSAARSVPIDSGVVGSVVALRDPHELVGEQSVLFIDRGSEDGVHLGDVFQIGSPSSSGFERDQVKVLIVYTRPQTSTALVIQIDRPDVRPGATARQIRRMPS
jgi:hypothetical protein